MPLSLQVRKGIRDYEPNLKEALETIKKATGKDFTLDVDWEANIAQLDASYKPENIGYLYQKEVLPNVAYCIENNCKDEMVKEAFNGATSNNKILIRVNDKIDNWWVYKFENGNLVLEHKKSISNTADLSYVTLSNILPSTGLPLLVRMNLEEKKKDLDYYLSSISSTTGTGEWIVKADFNSIVPKLKDNAGERIGTIYYSEVLYGIDYLLKNKLTNPITKEAFNEATPTRTIIFQVNEKLNNWWELSFKDGALVVQHKPDICNTGDVSSYDIESIIPVSGKLSLISKLNLADKKGDFDNYLAKITSAAGVEFTFDESSVEPFYSKLNESEKSRIGTILYSEMFYYLAENLSRALADDMVKEAFLEAASSHQIAVRVNQNQSDWWDIKIENGVVIVSAKLYICNIGDIGSINIEKLL